MPRKFFKSISPAPEALRKTPLLRVFGDVLLSPWLWHLHRHTVSMACFVGVFCAFIPIPAQMLFAAALAIVMRCHLPIAITLVWISNPLTMPAFIYFSYLLGCFLIQTPPIKADATNVLTLSFIWQELDTIWLPLITGSLVAGIFFGSIAYGVVRIGWRVMVVRKWFARKHA